MKKGGGVRGVFPQKEKNSDEKGIWGVCPEKIKPIRLDEIKKVGIELLPPEKNKEAHYFISSGGTQLSCPQNKNTAGVIKFSFFFNHSCNMYTHFAVLFIKLWCGRGHFFLLSMHFYSVCYLQEWGRTFFLSICSFSWGKGRFNSPTPFEWTTE